MAQILVRVLSSPPSVLSGRYFWGSPEDSRPLQEISLISFDLSLVGEEVGDQDQEGAHLRLPNDLEEALGQEYTSIISNVLYSVQWPSHILRAGEVSCVYPVGCMGVESGDKSFLQAGGVIINNSSH